jgi:hypothetical protein
MAHQTFSGDVSGRDQASARNKRHSEWYRPKDRRGERQFSFPRRALRNRMRLHFKCGLHRRGVPKPRGFHSGIRSGHVNSWYLLFQVIFGNKCGIENIGILTTLIEDGYDFSFPLVRRYRESDVHTLILATTSSLSMRLVCNLLIL